MSEKTPLWRCGLPPQRPTPRFSHERMFEYDRQADPVSKSPRAVAEHRNDGFVAAGQVSRDGHAECGGDAGRCVARTENVVFGFAAHRKAGDTAAFTQRVELIAAPAQNLVNVRLMANVPNQLVGRKIEHAMQRDCKFDDAEIRRQMAAVARARYDEYVANLTCEHVEFFTG